MPVLLLAQGHPRARDMLRKAIEARYGVRPPALDNLFVHFKGRAHVKVGPVMTWVAVEAKAYFRFPTAMRWDFTVKPLKLPVERVIEAFDGADYRSSRGIASPVVVKDMRHIVSMRRRMWAIASIMLTPLNEVFVHLSITPQGNLIAANTELDESVEIILRKDNSVDYVCARCFNAEAGAEQSYIVSPSKEMTVVNNLLVPARFRVLWDYTPSFELEPVTVKSNERHPTATFAAPAG